MVNGGEDVELSELVEAKKRQDKKKLEQIAPTCISLPNGSYRKISFFEIEDAVLLSIPENHNVKRTMSRFFIVSPYKSVLFIEAKDYLDKALRGVQNEIEVYCQKGNIIKEKLKKMKNYEKFSCCHYNLGKSRRK
ncbi:hypothetical protein EZS27_020781 [termite gut metagenome]|uniref:Uncharacterized protein n=1 Tax=termite gut metagenome TaxID=433724 RepID=A0A5J4R998_9ZZZZ